MSSNKIRLKDIADRAGVTVASVSMALRNHPRISKKRRQEIQALAEEMGYHRDARLGELMSHLRKGKDSGQRGVIAVLTGYGTPDHWKGMTSLVSFVEGAKAQAAYLGYRLEFFWAADPKLSPARLQQILISRGIRGVLVMRLPEGYPAEEIDWSSFCPVRQIDAVELPGMRMVRGNQASHARTAASEMVKRGYRRCALIVHRRHSDLIKTSWRMGFRDVMENAGVSYRVAELEAGLQGKEADALSQWEPDAIAFSVTETAFTWQNRFCSGSPFPYVSLNLNSSDHVSSGLVNRHDLVGGQAISMIVGQIQRNQPGLNEVPEQVLFEGQWQEGSTLPVVTAS